MVNFKQYFFCQHLALDTIYSYFNFFSFFCSSDPVPIQSRPYSSKTIFTPHQKAELEALFQERKYPCRNEKLMLAKSLGIPNNKITVCLLDLSFLGFPARVVLLSCTEFTNYYFSRLFA